MIIILFDQLSYLFSRTTQEVMSQIFVHIIGLWLHMLKFRGKCTVIISGAKLIEAYTVWGWILSHSSFSELLIHRDKRMEKGREIFRKCRNFHEVHKKKTFQWLSIVLGEHWALMYFQPFTPSIQRILDRFQSPKHKQANKSAACRCLTVSNRTRQSCLEWD